MEALIEQLNIPELKAKGVTLSVKREDLLHPEISGNKYRKLKYNLQAARKEGYSTLLTFGGAFSNHIAATAYAGRIHGFKTIGIIRGEELAGRELNPTLAKARACGMELKFISRAWYRQKHTSEFKAELDAHFGPVYVLPEGGTNELAVHGCTEILGAKAAAYNYICCCVGTGGTLAGIIRSALPSQYVLGFPVLKGGFLKKDICSFVKAGHWGLCENYHFGGYARIDRSLIEFVNHFKTTTGIPLDPVYTGKMLYGIMDLIKMNFFPEGSNILAIHTGGLQGIEGMNTMLKTKNLPLIR